jgi:hypothetical protein
LDACPPASTAGNVFSILCQTSARASPKWHPAAFCQYAVLLAAFVCCTVIYFGLAHIVNAMCIGKITVPKLSHMPAALMPEQLHVFSIRRC